MEGRSDVVYTFSVGTLANQWKQFSSALWGRRREMSFPEKLNSIPASQFLRGSPGAGIPIRGR
jgi:hypothetical protein